MLDKKSQQLNTIYNILIWNIGIWIVKFENLRFRFIILIILCYCHPGI